MIPSFVATRTGGPFLFVRWTPMYYSYKLNRYSFEAETYRYPTTCFEVHLLTITGICLLPFSHYILSKLRTRLCVTCVCHVQSVVFRISLPTFSCSLSFSRFLSRPWLSSTVSSLVARFSLCLSRTIVPAIIKRKNICSALTGRFRSIDSPSNDCSWSTCWLPRSSIITSGRYRLHMVSICVFSIGTTARLFPVAPLWIGLYMYMWGREQKEISVDDIHEALPSLRRHEDCFVNSWDLCFNCFLDFISSANELWMLDSSSIRFCVSSGACVLGCSKELKSGSFSRVYCLNEWERWMAANENAMYEIEI